jgi:hypothetical protein
MSRSTRSQSKQREQEPLRRSSNSKLTGLEDTIQESEKPGPSRRSPSADPSPDSSDSESEGKMSSSPHRELAQ